MSRDLNVITDDEYAEIATAMGALSRADAVLINVASTFAAELTQFCLAVIQRGGDAAVLEYPDAIGLALARVEIQEGSN